MRTDFALLSAYQHLVSLIAGALIFVALAIITEPVAPFVTLSAELALHGVSALAFLGVFLFTLRLTSRSPTNSK
jgi:predicted ATPase